MLLAAPNELVWYLIMRYHITAKNVRPHEQVLPCALAWAARTHYRQSHTTAQKLPTYRWKRSSAVKTPRITLRMCASKTLPCTFSQNRLLSRFPCRTRTNCSERCYCRRALTRCSSQTSAGRWSGLWCCWVFRKCARCLMNLMRNCLRWRTGSRRPLKRVVPSPLRKSIARTLNLTHLYQILLSNITFRSVNSEPSFLKKSAVFASFYHPCFRLMETFSHTLNSRFYR